MSESVKMVERVARPKAIARQQGKILQPHSRVRNGNLVSSHSRSGRLLGESRAKKALYRTIDRVAPSGAAVLMVNDRIAIDEACGLPLVEARSSVDAANFDGTRMTIHVGAALVEIARQAILSTLRFCRDNKRETAKVLGMSLKTLYARLALYKGLQHSPGERC